MNPLASLPLSVRIARLEQAARFFGVPLSRTLETYKRNAASTAADIAKMERTGATMLRGFTLDENRATYAAMLETIAAVEATL